MHIVAEGDYKQIKHKVKEELEEHGIEHSTKKTGFVATASFISLVVMFVFHTIIRCKFNTFYHNHRQ